MLIITNALVFLVFSIFRQNTFFLELGIQSPEIFQDWKIWQPFTYLFIHQNFWHLAFNMFALWMFGADVEEKFGLTLFFIYYFITGIGAGWLVAGTGFWAGESTVTMGASGSIFGVLLAYGILFAERELTLLIFFILPVRMRARTMVFLFGVFEFIAGVGQPLGRVSHLAHLGGLLVGYLFFLVRWPDLAERLHFWRKWFSSSRRLTLHRGEYVNLESEVDRILDKISRRGINSLTANEKKILAQAAQNKRRQWPEEN
jgi:membrane associated rhomboid family serine protease